ncbi:hypothetical protein K8S19_05680 [bacterium]|nr:hypothetical protein [bacterium]
MRRIRLWMILGMAGLVAGCGGPQKFIETEADPAAMALDARGRYLYVACEGAEKVSVWDVKKKKRLKSVDVAIGPIRLYLDRDNQTLRILCSEDKRLYLYQVPEMTLLGKMDLPDEPSAMVTRDARQFIFCSAKSNQIYPFVQKNPLPTINAGIDPQDMLLQIETGLLWVANYKAHTVSVIDLDRNQVIKEMPVWPNPMKLLSTPMGERLFVLCRGSGREPPRSVVQLIDPFYKKAGLTWQAGPDALDMVMDSMGRNLYILEPGRIRLISVKTGTQILECKTVKKPANLVVSPDGMRVYVSDREMHTVVMHTIKKKKLVKQ